MATTRRQRHREQVRVRAAALLDEPPPATREVTTPPPSPPVRQKTPLKRALEQPVLLPEEVAMLLRVDPEIILKLAADGDLLSMQMCGETRILRKDLLQFMYEMRAKPETLKKYKQSAVVERAYSDD